MAEQVRLPATPTADHVARVIVAACRQTGDDPIACAEGRGGPTIKGRAYAFVALCVAFPRPVQSVMARLVGAGAMPSFVPSSLSICRGAVKWWSPDVLNVALASIGAPPASAKQGEIRRLRLGAERRLSEPQIAALRAMQKLADADGIVTISRNALARAAEIPRNSVDYILGALVGSGRIVKVSTGGPTEASTYRLGETNPDVPVVAAPSRAPRAAVQADPELANWTPPALSRMARITDHRVEGSVNLGEPPPGRSALDKRRRAGR